MNMQIYFHNKKANIYLGEQPRKAISVIRLYLIYGIRTTKIFAFRKKHSSLSNIWIRNSNG